MNRYKPVGWRNERQRHYLAAKGIKTKVDRFVDILEMKENAWTEKKPVQKTKADEFADILKFKDNPWMKRDGAVKTSKAGAVADALMSKDNPWFTAKGSGKAQEFADVLMLSDKKPVKHRVVRRKVEQVVEPAVEYVPSEEQQYPEEEEVYAAEKEPEFTVVITGKHATHYLDGIPLSDEETKIARRKYGEPEHEEDPHAHENDDGSYSFYAKKHLSEGAKVELEHKKTILRIEKEKPTPEVAAGWIADDHTKEHKGYYPALQKMEKTLK